MTAERKVPGTDRGASSAARSRQRRRPLWKHIVFWGSAFVTGVLLAVFRAPEWAGYVAVAVGCFTLLPWFMVSGGRDGR